MQPGDVCLAQYYLEGQQELSQLYQVYWLATPTVKAYNHILNNVSNLKMCLGMSLGLENENQSLNRYTSKTRKHKIFTRTRTIEMKLPVVHRQLQLLEVADQHHHKDH